MMEKNNTCEECESTFAEKERVKRFREQAGRNTRSVADEIVSQRVLGAN